MSMGINVATPMGFNDGMAAQPQPQVKPTLGSFIKNTFSGLSKADAVKTSMVEAPKGSIPATGVNVSSNPSTGSSIGSIGNSSRIGSIGSSVVKGASRAANSVASSTKEVGTIIRDEILPKPDSLNSKAIRNRFLGAIVFGGIINGVNTAINVGKGEYSAEEGLHRVIAGTAVGAVGGASFVGGMSLGSKLLAGVMGGVPLSVATITVGALASIGVTQAIKGIFSGWDL